MRGATTVGVSLVLLSFVTSAPAARTIQFPERSVGTLSIQPEENADFGYNFGASGSADWQDHGPAAGKVTVPDGFLVRLILNQAAAEDPSWIDVIPDDAIDAISAGGLPLGDAGFHSLSRLASLRSLYLNSADLTSAIATDIPRLQRLQYLWLGGNVELGDAAMPAIAALPELQSIGIYRTGVTDAGLGSLSKSRSIRAVYAGYTRITDAGFAALTKLPDLRAVNVLATVPELARDAHNPAITDAGLAHLADCPNLEYLNVSGARLTDAGLTRLTLDCPRLRGLVIDDTAVTGKGLRCIGSLSRLERLNCRGSEIDDSVVEHFQSLERMRTIDGDFNLGNAGAKALAALPRLEHLSLSGSCDDACMESVAAMPLLKRLSLQDTQITDDGFALLSGSETLEWVSITRNRMTTRCIETLATIPQLKHVHMMGVDPRADGEPVWTGLEELHASETLSLYNCAPVGEGDFAKFAQLQNLEELRIERGRPATDADVRQLRGLERLACLELSSSLVSDEGLMVLASLPKLNRLHISCLATVQGLEALVAGSPSLTSLTIGSPDLTDEQVEDVRTAHPELRSLRLTGFRLGGAVVSRSTSGSDVFWRRGTQAERSELNALEGKPAPDLAVSGWLSADEGTTLDAFEGKIVLVEFWGTWCGPCLARMPELRRLHEEYAGRGLVIVGLHSTRGAESAAQYVASHSIPWPVALDDDRQTARAYAVTHYPSFFLIDRQGVLKLANPYSGDLEAAVQSLLSE